MVGLPYPNPSDPELQERMRYLDAAAAAPAAASREQTAATPPAAAATGSDAGAQQPALPTRRQTGREYYTGLCMKAVNQCVGRVIRHRGDWAAVLLVDARYAAGVDAHGRLAGPLEQLPAWIQQSLEVAPSFGEAFGRLARFCKATAAADVLAAAADAAGAAPA